MVKATGKTEAYLQGMRDCKTDKELTDNPYAHGSQQFNDWVIGFLDALESD